MQISPILQLTSYCSLKQAFERRKLIENSSIGRLGISLLLPERVKKLIMFSSLAGKFYSFIRVTLGRVLTTVKAN
jgi:hypothetical protein